MNHEEAGSALPQGVSWVFAVLAGIFAAFVLFLVDEVLQSVTPNNGTIAYVAYAVVAVATTYFICRAYPSSRWHAPILCNAPGILAAFLEPAIWTLPTWPIIVGGWVATLVALLLATKGRRPATADLHPYASSSSMK